MSAPKREASRLLVKLVLSGVFIAGGYQFYFWCQRNAPFEAREFSSSLDRLVPYAPEWVWIYTTLYFLGIVYLNFTLRTLREYAAAAASYMLLLALQVACFLSFPVRTPQSWRIAAHDPALSERLLAYVQSIDAPSNCFPSMHASVAMLTALHLFGRHGPVVLAFPALVGLSCLFTKQHYVVDIPAGMALGWVTFAMHQGLSAKWLQEREKTP